ncbi:hypothetical protein ACFX5K_02675, partial [Rickettsiales bacterium LUAb2]
TITRGTNNDNISGFNYFHGSSKEGDNIKVDNIANTMQGGFSIVLTKGTSTAINFTNVNETAHTYNFVSNDPNSGHDTPGNAGDTTNGQLVGIYEDTADHSTTGANFYGQFVGANQITLTSGNDIFQPSFGLTRSGVTSVDGSYGINTFSMSNFDFSYNPNPSQSVNTNGIDINLGGNNGFAWGHSNVTGYGTVFENFNNIQVVGDKGNSEYTKIVFETRANVNNGYVHTFNVLRTTDTGGHQNMNDNVILCRSGSTDLTLDALFTGNQEVFTSGDSAPGNMTVIGQDFAINNVGWHFNSATNRAYNHINLTLSSYLDFSNITGTEVIYFRTLNNNQVNVDQYLAANYTATTISSTEIDLTQNGKTIKLEATDGATFNVTPHSFLLGNDDSGTHGLSATDYQNFSQTAVTWDNGNDYLNNLNNKTNSTDFWSNFDKQLNDQANAKGNNTNSSSNGNNTSGNAVQHNNAMAKPASDNNSSSNKNSSNEHHNDNGNTTTINHSHVDTNTNSAHAVKQANAEANSDHNTSINHKHSEVNHSSSSDGLDLHAILNAAKNSVNQDGGNHVHNASFSSVMSSEVSHLMQNTYQHDEANTMSYTLGNSVHYDSNSDGNNMVNHTHKENKDHHNH